jgi:PAS domain S-box-containing protein
MIGYEREELLQMSIPDVEAVETLEETGRRIKKIMAQGSDRFESRHKRKDGKVIDVEVSVNYLGGAEGQFFVFVRDITERKKMENALRESEEKFRSIVENSSDQIFMLDKDCKFLSINKTAADISKKSPQEMIGKPIFEIFPVETADRFSKNIKNVFDTGKSMYIEEKMFIQGREFDNSTSLNPVKDDKGRVVAVTGIVRDITERKRAQEALQKSEEKYRSLVNNIQLGIFRSTPGPLGKFLEVNPAMETITGYPREELLRMSVSDLYVHPEEREAVLKGVATLVGKTTRELNFKRKDGSEIAVSDTKVAVRDGSGKVMYFDGIVEDVTRRKRAEEEIYELTQYLESVIDNADILLDAMDCEGNVLVWNKAAEAITGYSREEVLGHNKVWKWLYPDTECRRAITAKAATVFGGEVVEDVEVTVRTKSGQDRMLSWYGRRLLDEEGNPIGAVWLGTDVTERKKAEEALKQSEKRYRLLADNATDVIWTMDMNLRLTYISPSITRMLGYTVDEAMAQTLEELLTPSSLAVAMKTLAEELAIENLEEKDLSRSRTLELELRRKDASTVWAEAKVTFLRDQDGRSSGLLGETRDITERKRAEEGLRESEERFRSLVENAPYMIIILDRASKILFINYTVSGFAADSVIGTSIYDYISLEFHAEVRRCVEQVFETGEPAAYEITGVGPDGTTSWYFTRVGPIKHDGKTIAVTLIATDITERKRAEEALLDSEKKYSTLVERGNDGIVIIQDGSIKYANTKMVDISGFSVEEIIGKRFVDFLSPEYGKLVTDRYRRRMAGEHVLSRYEIEILARDGTSIPLEINASSIEYEGKPADMAIIRDITERKKAEEALRESEEFSSSLLSSSPIAMIVINPDTSVRYVNPALEKLTGFSLAELIGRKAPYPWWTEEMLQKTTRDLEQAMVKGARNVEELFQKRNGERFWVEITSGPILRNGEFKYYLANWVDITGRKKGEQAQRQLQQEVILASRLASIGRMASGIAHEINNPLTGVVGFSDLLLKKDIPEDIRGSVKIIYDGAQRVAGVISRLLTFARQSKPERTYVNINDIIENTLALRAYEMRNSNIEATTQLDPDLPWTMADAGQLQQVFLNIILNAEAEMTRAHGSGNLLVKTERMDSAIRASFKDDGPGIPKENLGKIFEPFFTTREVGQGTGLGLSVCHGIVAEHGGRIYARSALGKGATFFVELPIVTEAAQLKPVEPPAAEPERVSGGRILVIDDEPVVQQFLTEVLSGEGHEVETADNGEDALEKLESEDYDVILVDVKLPGMSGIEIYKHLQRVAKPLARRVVFITGDVMGEDTMAFLSKAKARYITKPFNTERLRKDIQTVLSQRR